MIYAFFADYSKKAAHALIEATFPRTSTIAAISAFSGYYAYSYYETWGRSYTAELLGKYLVANGIPQFIANNVVAPGVIPSISPYIATSSGIITSTSVSLILNLFSMVIYGKISIKDKEEKSKEPEPLKEIAIVNATTDQEESISIGIEPGVVDEREESKTNYSQLSSDQIQLASLQIESELAQKKTLEKCDTNQAYNEEYIKKQLCCYRLWL